MLFIVGMRNYIYDSLILQLNKNNSIMSFLEKFKNVNLKGKELY